MHKITRTLRIGLLYALAVFMVGGVPLTALAETTPTTTNPPVTAPAPATVSSASTTPDVTPVSVTPPLPVNTITAAPPTPTVATQSPQTVTEPAPLPVTTNTVAPGVNVTPSTESPVANVVPPSTSAATSLTTNVPSSLPATSAVTTTGVANNITSAAHSGNAQTTTNTTVGDTASGNAAANTTVINAVHSTVQGDTKGVARFTADINGNVTGDITLAPSINGALSQSDANPTHNLQVNNSTGLTNNINLDATSGNVDVTKNTTAGNATTGNASTIANVVNLINSIIAANQSFVGTINIYGNLNGDILVSPNFIPQLLASNASNSTLNSALGPLTSDLASDNNQSIINNINLQATSGNAAATANTTVGDVSTGNAQTNLTVLNLTGHKVVASNSLLVFVNVLGKWVGMIVDAPGATAAALGNGVTSNTLNPFDQSINAQNSSQITNNINLASRSGNANAFANTTIGDVRTGNATASANIANIATSSFSLSDWFGILFINVFGTWYGSFGINTASGEVVPIDAKALPVNISNGSAAAPAVRFGFTPRTFATLHQNTLPLRMPVSTRVISIPVVHSDSQDQTITLAGVVQDEPTDQGGDEIMVPATSDVARGLNPLAIALMATGFVGMTAPVLASLGHRRRNSRSVIFNK